MTITVIATGNIKESYLTSAISEYKKRIGAYARVEEIILKEEKIQNEDDRREVERALVREGEAILRALPKDAFKIALCVEGVQYDSVALAHLLDEGSAVSGKVALVIGSSHGLCEEVKRACDLRLSVSKLTFPHQLLRAMLYEILYRSLTIIKGKRYHK